LILRYNEDDILFLKTLNSVITNITELCNRTRSKTWGPSAWQKVVICVVQDGRKLVNPRTLKVLQLMGVYSEGVMKSEVAGKAVEGHIFE
jgi:chitin synthase